jgi:hypothetical protein
VGAAVCVAVEVGVGICADAVGVGVWTLTVAAGACVVVAVALALAVGAGSWASAMPPTTAANRPAQHRRMARIFLGDKLALLHARGAGREARLRTTSASVALRLSNGTLGCAPYFTG